jgi:hypothetical protein
LAAQENVNPAKPNRETETSNVKETRKGRRNSIELAVKKSVKISQIRVICVPKNYCTTFSEF